MSVFIDTSVWFATAVARDRNNARAKSIMRDIDRALTTDHESSSRRGCCSTAVPSTRGRSLWMGFRRGGAGVEMVTMADMHAAWVIGDFFTDQDFSVVDRTSFAVMERLGLTRVASFDNDFAV